MAHQNKAPTKTEIEEATITIKERLNFSSPEYTHQLIQNFENDEKIKKRRIILKLINDLIQGDTRFAEHVMNADSINSVDYDNPNNNNAADHHLLAEGYKKQADSNYNLIKGGSSYVEVESDYKLEDAQLAERMDDFGVYEKKHMEELEQNGVYSLARVQREWSKDSVKVGFAFYISKSPDTYLYENGDFFNVIYPENNPNSYEWEYFIYKKEINIYDIIDAYEKKKKYWNNEALGVLLTELKEQINYKKNEGEIGYCNDFYDVYSSLMLQGSTSSDDLSKDTIKVNFWHVYSRNEDTREINLRILYKLATPNLPNFKKEITASTISSFNNKSKEKDYILDYIYTRENAYPNIPEVMGLIPADVISEDLSVNNSPMARSLSYVTLINKMMNGLAFGAIQNAIPIFSENPELVPSDDKTYRYINNETGERVREIPLEFGVSALSRTINFIRSYQNNISSALGEQDTSPNQEDSVAVAKIRFQDQSQKLNFSQGAWREGFNLMHTARIKRMLRLKEVNTKYKNEFYYRDRFFARLAKIGITLFDLYGVRKSVLETNKEYLQRVSFQFQEIIREEFLTKKEIEIISIPNNNLDPQVQEQIDLEQQRINQKILTKFSKLESREESLLSNKIQKEAGKSIYPEGIYLVSVANKLSANDVNAQIGMNAIQNAGITGRMTQAELLQFDREYISSSLDYKAANRFRAKRKDNTAELEALSKAEDENSSFRLKDKRTVSPADDHLIHFGNHLTLREELVQKALIGQLDMFEAEAQLDVADEHSLVHEQNITIQSVRQEQAFKEMKQRDAQVKNLTVQIKSQNNEKRKEQALIAQENQEIGQQARQIQAVQQQNQNFQQQ